MTKTKTPFFSLGSAGSIADSITSQKRGSATLLRNKPTPTDIYSLPQAYHRWLYQDYVAYWHDQTPATKQLWQTNARPYHMTGFAYWIKYHLTNLPDIAAAYHLDYITNNTVIDFSKNLNHGTVYGASLAPGIIHKALSFDGTDDYVNCGTNLTLDLNSSFTIECWTKHTTTAHAHLVIKHGGSPARGYRLSVDNIGRFYTRLLCTDGNVTHATTPASYNDNKWHHVVAKRDTTTDMLYIYVDGLLKASTTDLTTGSLINPAPLKIAPKDTVFFAGLVDELPIYNRAIPDLDIKRHSERRYPS